MSGIYGNVGQPLLMPASSFATGESVPPAHEHTSRIDAHKPEAAEMLASQPSDGLKDTNGAPLLSQPTTTLSMGDMEALLQYLYAASEHSQLEAHKGDVMANASKSRQANEAQLEKIKASIEEEKNASKSGRIGRIFGLIGKIAAVVAAGTAMAVALGLTPFSAGATAPLVVLAGMGLAAATMSLIDHSVKMAGGPEISLSNGLTKLTTLILTRCGVPEEQAEKIGRVAAGATGTCLILPVLMEPQLLSTMATGICQLSGASDTVTGWVAMGVAVTAALGVGAIMFFASGGTSSPALFESILNASSSGIQAITNAGEGGAGIATAVYQNRADNLIADKKELDALISKISLAMETAREEIKKLLEQIQDSVVLVSRMFSENSESILQIINSQNRQAV